MLPADINSFNISSSRNITITKSFFYSVVVISKNKKPFNPPPLPVILNMIESHAIWCPNYPLDIMTKCNQYRSNRLHGLGL